MCVVLLNIYRNKCTCNITQTVYKVKLSIACQLPALQPWEAVLEHGFHTALELGQSSTACHLLG